MMNAMILAAGLGTRLRPWTLHHPKALVPVGGVPMLRRVIERLRTEGFGRLIVNVHHFSDQIVAYLNENDFGVEIFVSDESGELLDTGGGIAAASELFEEGPVLVHNVDILSDAPLCGVMEKLQSEEADVMLLTSDRQSSRRLLFRDGRLCGWKNLSDGALRLAHGEKEADLSGHAFSGIYAIGPRGLEELKNYGHRKGTRSFPILDFFLSFPDKISIREMFMPELNLIDIGKPDTLQAVADFPGIL